MAWRRTVAATHVITRRLLGTNLFSLSQAEQHPYWLKEARIGEHTAETRSTASRRLCRSRNRWTPGACRCSSTRTRAGRPRGPDLPRLVPVMAQARIVRAKGLVWLSTQQGHWQQGMKRRWPAAGSRWPGNLWAAVVRNPARIDRGALSICEEPYGDRRTELVADRRVEMDHTVHKALEACDDPCGNEFGRRRGFCHVRAAWFTG